MNKYPTRRSKIHDAFLYVSFESNLEVDEFNIFRSFYFFLLSKA